MPGPQPYVLGVPANFPQPPDMPDNPLTDEGVALGRQLFYEKKLSGNNQISCASCHVQSLGFADGIALTAIGVSRTTLLRHSPALINLAWANNGLFWDGGSTNLESQAFGPLTAHDEMAQNLQELVLELNATSQYPLAFQRAFKSEVSAANIVKALAQFQRTLVSGNSRYDKYIRKEPGGSLTETELAGLQLVQQKCQACHATDLFTDQQYHNNGIDNQYPDQPHEGIYLGRSRVSFQTKDIGAYRTPTLRNIMQTAPYMHDGRFSTIEQVLQHYANGVKYSASLAPELQKNGVTGIALSTIEQERIIAFLKTLTDSSFINNKKFSSPF